MPLFILTALGWFRSAGASVLQTLSDWRVLAVLAAVLAVLWGLHETRRADGLAVAKKASDAALAAAHQTFLTEQATLHRLTAARSTDHRDAVTDANGSAKSCQARVDTARKSATAITHMLNEAPHANPDPAEPVMLDAGQLRHALGR